MKSVAALFIILAAVVNILLMMIYSPGDVRGGWETVRSPLTGRCYEMRTNFLGLGISRAMAPVDDVFCEEGKGPR